MRIACIAGMVFCGFMMYQHTSGNASAMGGCADDLDCEHTAVGEAQLAKLDTQIAQAEEEISTE